MEYVQYGDALWGRFHATGTRLFGRDGWKLKRPALVGFFSRGRTASSKAITHDEMLAICEHLDRLLLEQASLRVRVESYG